MHGFQDVLHQNNLWFHSFVLFKYPIRQWLHYWNMEFHFSSSNTCFCFCLYQKGKQRHGTDFSMSFISRRQDKHSVRVRQIKTRSTPMGKLDSGQPSSIQADVLIPSASQSQKKPLLDPDTKRTKRNLRRKCNLKSYLTTWDTGFSTNARVGKLEAVCYLIVITFRMKRV